MTLHKSKDSADRVSMGHAMNQLVIGGNVCKPAKLTHSPAGISHLHFSLEHVSEQIEAQLPRRSYLRIQVVYSGTEAKQWINELSVGTEVTVTGFLNRQEDSNGLAKLVLHAQQLSKI